MRRVVLFLAGAGILSAQGRPLDWPTFGGDAQRTGWQKTDLRITKDNAKDLQLVLKRKFDNTGAGPRSLSPPVVIGNLISYKGFKELGFVAGAPDSMWSIDVDLDRPFWSRKFEVATRPSGPCAAVATAVPALTPPNNFTARRRPAANAAPAPPAQGMMARGSVYSQRPAFALSSDGKLHVLNTSTGEDLLKAVQFIPAGAKATNLVIVDGFIYTTTTSACGGTPGVWAIDLGNIDPKNPEAVPPVLSHKAQVGGLAFGTDNTVYVHTSDGELLALGPKDLVVKAKYAGLATPATPIVFQHGGRDVIGAAGAKGAVVLLDSQGLAVLAQTPASVTSGRGIAGGLATWADDDGGRWILAPVWGAPKSGVTAFKVEEESGKVLLKAQWTREMNAPAIPVIGSGVVFALSAGDYASEDAKGSGRAVLYAIDGVSGKDLYSTGTQVSGPANLNGLTLANGRVYFATADNTLWAFGIFLER